MIVNKALYWIAQLVGWTLYATLLFFFNFLEGRESTTQTALSLAIICLSGIITTHFFRFVIIRYDLLRLSIAKAILIVLISSVFIGFGICFLIAVLHSLFMTGVNTMLIGGSLAENLQLSINFMFIGLFWSVLYFTSHYFFNYKREEIKNLRLAATQTESELINLRAQLNPHFMFNALNSIRALIDEEPKNAKMAITQLSAMLRGALQTGKRQVIPLEDELTLVNNYLAIEKVRFEERIHVEFEVENAAKSYRIPPLLLQTLVENAVKHGISSLTEGGTISIIAKLDQQCLLLMVKNSGVFDANKPSRSTGIGLQNTRRRLGLLYGDQASIQIENINNQVVTSVVIPLNLSYENPDN